MMLTLLAQAENESINKIFGGGVENAPLSEGSVGSTFSQVFGFVLSLIIGLAALYVLTMMLWGAFDWISSGGESEKLKKAQGKITNAVIGIFVLLGVLVLWIFVGTNILGTVDKTESGFQLRLPSVRDIGKSDDTPAPRTPPRTPPRPPIEPR